MLLFKSNTHLNFPGQSYLADMAKIICANVKPPLVLSIGTAGGSRLQDHLGAVNVVNAATLYESGQSSSSWPTYTSGFAPSWSVIGNTSFS